MYEIARHYRHEFLTPEHLLLALIKQPEVRSVIKECGGDLNDLSATLISYIQTLDTVSEVANQDNYSPTLSYQLQTLLSLAAQMVASAQADCLTISHLLRSLLTLEDSNAASILNYAINNRIGDFFAMLLNHNSENIRDRLNAAIHIHKTDNEVSEVYDEVYDFPYPDSSLDIEEEDTPNWKNMVTCVNDHLQNRNPLIGREKELERTMQVLCRKDKNNPLHIGEPGVGKTALVYGLAQKIKDGKVPDRLRDAKIYQLDLGNLIAGTQFRGDFEKKIKEIMDGVEKEENPIIYIDEIHSLVGAGAVGESSLDASNMLKPYLEAGKIRFIGSTTYEEYKKHFARSKGIVRRFQQIDILEPSIDETINILNQLKKGYEAFHGVYYLDKAIEFAVHGAAKHITGRFLPDKAIDLIDEAGAYREIHPLPQKRQTVDTKLISQILAKVAKVDAIAIDEKESTVLDNLEKRISAKIFGQEEAVKQVTEAVLIAKAGIEDDTKPLASLLFVGPTGVGKTEVAKVLAEELAIPLVRFDMSEYTEKHAVAKLIGSPAGYVGYEDGGLLTDAIRKTPNCVLLLDEIEKAHEDIYNILLQVMDYASLTDNKGNKADFRNVILIMTSNAGAQFANQAKIGFGNTTTAGSAMMKQVKKVFKPEFINRLSDTVIFNDMNQGMASLILDKKLHRLSERLASKKVTLSLSDEAREFIIKKAFTKEYGAREIDRVISSSLKPLLMREILFGKLKKGGNANITLSANQLEINF
ncbi:MAG: AAA domain-containing protein [Bacteroides sp.]|nr:AAA domain-containing protein [Bacteroides sp.]